VVEVQYGSSELSRSVMVSGIPGYDS